MARIRSIKPEFWKSEDIAALDWDTRLLFIGLWSYVDDNGVGRDNEKLIVAELFPLEEDPRETFARVSRGLQRLFQGGLITRYEVDGRAFLYIVSWGKHQRIDKPNKARYELPTSDNALIRETVSEPSRNPRETPAPGAVDLGNRGTGDTPTGASPADPPAPAPKAPEQIITTNAYERVGKAFKYVSVLQIAKWAINIRGSDPQAVEDAIVAIYELGKPITKQTVGQFLDGHIARTSNGNHHHPSADQKVQTYLSYGRPASALKEIE